MAHEFDHHRTVARTRLKIALILTFALFVAEFVGGLWANSLALLSDAGHMLADLVALTLTLLSIRWANKPADTRKTYGYYRAEILVTFVNGALLLYVAFQILWEAAHRFFAQEPVVLEIMLPVALAGLVVNVVALGLLHGTRQLLVTRSAFYHVLSDLLASIGVVGTALLIRTTGLSRLDTAASVVISVLILVNAVRLLREAFGILMEGSPAHVVLADVRAAMLDVDGVEDVHDLHVWTIGSGFHAASAHLHVPNMDTRRSEAIVREVAARLRDRFAITHTTLQVEELPVPTALQTLP